mmetsp:Transcript_51615/g.102546  ORF Transcript_51615/g.102546 Transcript_51615/m.102546 type:complete len:249 (-) Transcript_51615:87-833(-)
MKFSSSSCVPSWAEAGQLCPYGSVAGPPIAHFTWPPPQETTYFTYIAACYSTAPFDIALGLLISLICVHGVRDLFAVLFFFLQGAVMMTLKAAISQPRPTSSCLVSCGMPSGHTLMSVGFFTWFALEIVSRKENMTVARKFCWLLVAGIALLPVGWSRTVLGDHSWLQVCIGAFVGTALGGLWWYLLKQRCTYWLIKLLCAHIPLLVKNYPPDPMEEEMPWAQAGAGVPVAATSIRPNTQKDYGGTTH